MDKSVNKSFSGESHEELELLYQLGIALASGKDLFSTLLTLQTAILKLVRAEAMFIALYDELTDIVDYPIYFEVGMPQRQPSRHLSQNGIKRLDDGQTGLYENQKLLVECKNLL